MNNSFVLFLLGAALFVVLGLWVNYLQTQIELLEEKLKGKSDESPFLLRSRIGEMEKDFNINVNFRLLNDDVKKLSQSNEMILDHLGLAFHDGPFLKKEKNK
jgi:hypothetical protein